MNTSSDAQDRGASRSDGTGGRRVPYTRRRRRGVIAATGVSFLLLLSAVVALGVLRSRESPFVTERNPPTAYRIAYRIDQPGEDPPTKLQLLLVRRPFDGRNQSSRSDGKGVAGVATTIDRAWRFSDDAFTPLGAKLPSSPAGDARPLRVMSRALEEGLARRRGADRIEGRECVRYEVAEPLGRPLAAPTEASRTQLCIDRRGLVLEERWSRRGALVRLRRAIEVAIEPEVSEQAFFEDIARPDDAGFTRLDEEGAREAATVWLERPPRGFALAGAYRSGTTLSTAWVSGPDLITVEEAAAESSPWPEAKGGLSWSGALAEASSDSGAALPAPSASAAPLRGQLVLDLISSELRIELPADRWVRISGGVAPDVLERAAVGLRAKGG